VLSPQEVAPPLKMSRCTVFLRPYPSKTDRQTILSAAVRDLAHEGIRELSLRKIAASLDVAPNAIYRYFSNRPAARGCAGKRSGPAAGTGAEKGSRRVRTVYCNPQDVICLHQIRKGQPSSLRGDDESPCAGARCDLPPKPLGVHRRGGATNRRLGPSCTGVCRALSVPPWSRGVRSR
jgi:tetracycline repressor-like protein